MLRVKLLVSYLANKKKKKLIKKNKKLYQKLILLRMSSGVYLCFLC